MYITSCSLIHEFVDPSYKMLQNAAFDKRFERSLFMAFPMQSIHSPVCTLFLYALPTLTLWCFSRSKTFLNLVKGSSPMATKKPISNVRTICSIWFFLIVARLGKKLFPKIKATQLRNVEFLSLGTRKRKKHM